MTKLYTTWIVLLCLSPPVSSQTVTTEDITNGSERAIRIETLVNAPVTEVWAMFATEAGLMKWAAPVIRLDLRTGGTMYAHYDPNAEIGSPGTIESTIINFIEGEMITFKVNLNDSFPASIHDEDDYLQEIIQLVPVDAGTTRIVSVMTGWGDGRDWDFAYDFFRRGNTWTYEQLVKSLGE